MADEPKEVPDGNGEAERAPNPVETRSAGVQIDNVDLGQRIITVLAVPYEQATRVPFRGEMWEEVFSRSAFNGIEQARKVPIPATTSLSIPAPDHIGARLVGRILSADPYQDAGLVCDVKISRTVDGDETLELASDEALHPSVGFMVKNRLDQDLDTRAKRRRVNRAFLHHLAFVGEPAYEGAKVLAMRSNGLVAEELPSTTPRMDEFMSDPILQWASQRAAERARLRGDSF